MWPEGCHVGGNVRDPVVPDEMARDTEASLGLVDVLVSNAGIASQQDLEEITAEDWDQVMEVNLRPAFLLAERLTPGRRCPDAPPLAALPHHEELQVHC